MPISKSTIDFVNDKFRLWNGLGGKNEFEFIMLVINLLDASLQGYIKLTRATTCNEFIHWIDRAEPDCATPFKKTDPLHLSPCSSKSFAYPIIYQTLNYKYL